MHLLPVIIFKGKSRPILKKPYDISSSSVGVTVLSDLGAGQNQICEVVSESGLLKIFGQNFHLDALFKI